MKNILFLMADEFRYDVAGFMGNTVARTPNLDRLAAHAVVFDNAYTPSPVCVPARQCLATGKYPLHIGCERFGQDIAPGSATFARWFSEHGYFTTACGKLHHRGPDQMQGWMHRIGSETAVNWPEKFSSRSQIGRCQWRGAAELKGAGVGLSPLALHDDYSVRGACDFLKIHFDGLYAIPRETPVFLMVSLQQPHFPLRTEKELLDYYHARVPIFWNTPPGNHPNLDAGRLGESQGIAQSDVRRATATYYGMVEQTDRRIGQILQAIEIAGQSLEDWIIVFTSDHGEMLGEHGAWGKRKFYEGSARVPLFISSPGLSPCHSTAPGNLVDIFPTLVHLAGLPEPGGLDGRDLFGTEHPGETFCQHDRDNFMIRSENLKYLRFPAVPDVLFDLVRDPGETCDAIDDPAYAEAATALRKKLDKFIATACENGPPR